MGYNPRYAHPYVWIWPELNPNVFEYYEYILCYVDDVVCILADPGKYMNRIQGNFKLKYDKISDPEMYLGSTLYNMLLESGKAC